MAMMPNRMMMVNDGGSSATPIKKPVVPKKQKRRGGGGGRSVPAPVYTPFNFNYSKPAPTLNTPTTAPDYYAAIQNAAVPHPGDYTSKYRPMIEKMYSQMVQRGPFKYDLNADMLYQQMKEKYVQQGQKAMMNTMGQAAALTGGYGNSYAQTAAQQTYNQHLQSLNDQAPNLKARAYQEWLGEGDRIKQNLDASMQLDNYDYGQYRDRMSDWQYGQNQQMQLANAKTDNYYNWLKLQMQAKDFENENYWREREEAMRIALANHR